MSKFFAQKLAREILASYGDEGSFDLDFVDSATSDAVALELHRLGCEVIRWPFKSAIHVIVQERLTLEDDEVAALKTVSN